MTASHLMSVTQPTTVMCTLCVYLALSHIRVCFMLIDQILILFTINSCTGLNTLPFGVSVTEGDLRLVGSTANGHGAVEIYTRLGWSSICPDDEWTNSDAAVICQRLGYGSGRRDV